ncbi:hypothetical protein LKMONMHP_2388 [Methylobacterium organophilum]|uniref:Uncharacterized protein n=2 Tax=Methylobacterium organophilum TaxID=410 RepID=A0ABQ4T7E8_METOR|nr:hypothetical protein LKMONMHP_2388 [Methylobacterium organophilum]
MRDDTDARVGEVFRRLSIMRLELGETALDRTLRDVLQTLGVAAHREAEHRARILADRQALPRSSIRVTSYADRRDPEPWPEDRDA